MCNHDLMPVGRETAVCRKCGRIRWQDIAHFRKHLENAAAIVATWPEWKRKILGPIEECLSWTMFSAETQLD